MYNTNEFTNYQVNDSFKKIIISGLVILLTLVVLSSFSFVLSFGFDGRILGYLIFPLFIISEIPILINYFYLLITKLGLILNSGNSVIGKKYEFFSLYYTLGLIFHSGLYTIVLGLVIIHILLLIQQSTYCVILMLILSLMWIIEFIFWSTSWPLYPKIEQKSIFLYWIHWSLLFGLLIGLPFHVGTWNLFWMTVLPLTTFFPLLLLIGTDILEIRNKTQEVKQIESRTVYD